MLANPQDSLRLDLYLTDELLSEEERDFRSLLRSFVDKECMGLIADHFDRGLFPSALVPRLADLGLFGMHVTGYGCSPRSYPHYGIACEELGRCDSGLRAIVSVQNSLVMDPIFKYGSLEQKQRWLPAMARGELLGCFCLSEPEAGSNPAAIRTRAHKTGGKFILNGIKMWITHGTVAQLALIWAWVEEELRCFLVPTTRAGFSASPIQRKFSYRTSPTALITLENCEVSQDELLPHAKGLKDALQCLNAARYGVACGALGASLACYHAALSFAKKREVFKRPIASFQLVQQKLVDMAMEITKAQLLTLRLGRLLDQGKATAEQISLLKLNNVRMASNIARLSRDILGARGILADNHVIRHLCDMEAVSALEGTDSIHTLILGQKLTGTKAFF